MIPGAVDWQLTRGRAGPAEARVAECGGILLSLYVGMRKLLWVDGEFRPCVMVQDVLTHPNYRARGMLNALTASFLSEMRERNECGYTFPDKLSEKSIRRSRLHELSPGPGLGVRRNPTRGRPRSGRRSLCLYVIC